VDQGYAGERAAEAARAHRIALAVVKLPETLAALRMVASPHAPQGRRLGLDP
jgi:hypothetical protein